MGYTHYFNKKKDIPDPQWKTLCVTVSKVFHLLPEYECRNSYDNEPIIICDALGQKKIVDPRKLFDSDKGSGLIVFNGYAATGMDHESLVLRQKGEQECGEWFCKTARKPYDWFVNAVLILVHNLCPDCYEITSDGDVEWLPVIQWLNETLGTEYVIPLNVFVPDI